MAYRERTKKLVNTSPLTAGSRLGRRAVHLGVSVVDISRFTGATRRTVYNWFFGGYVIPAYRERVDNLYEVLRKAKTSEEAVRVADKKFTRTN